MYLKKEWERDSIGSSEQGANGCPPSLSFMQLWASLLTEVLSMSTVVSIDEEQRIATVHFSWTCRTFWDGKFLAMSGEQETILVWGIYAGSWWTWYSFSTSVTLESSRTCWKRVTCCHVEASHSRLYILLQHRAETSPVRVFPYDKNSTK